MLAKMTEGADVSDTANLSNIIVGADPLSALRTGTEHLIPNAFCVLNYMYVYRDKIAKPVNADYVSAGVQCTPLQKLI